MKRAILGMLLLAGLIAWLITDLGANNTDLTAGTSGNTAVIKLREQYAQGFERAKRWQGNATLARIYRVFHGSLTPETPEPMIFAYASLADPTHVFEVTFNGDAISDRKVDLPVYALRFTPLSLHDLEVDPDQALQLAEDGGGRVFREAHLAGYTTLEQLQQVEDYPMQWYFRYDTGDGSQRRHEIWVNAQTGKIDGRKETTVGNG